MGYFKELQIDIYELYDKGFTDEDIAKKLDITVAEVARVIERFEDDHDADPGDMDGDAASALASAGLGTDEDYGGGDERL